MSVGLLSLLSVCEVSSLVGSNALWTTTTVGKAFCKSTNGTMGRSIARTKGKFIVKGSINSSKVNVLLYL